MAECEKKLGFVDKIKDGLSYISQIVSASIFPPISEGTERVMRTIEKRIIQIVKRIVRNISSLLIIGFGSIFLIFAFFFFLIEYLSWTKAVSFFSIGITLFVIGLMLKLSESKR
ncbi:MAG: hypothetical protein PHV16_03275 [Candidatus Nanoarchaeia archaeon]|nr:hypothetical protein [Candidatus Nanoarchaeia archaeon]